MSESRSFSPWWALLLLPVALLVGWFAGGMPVPEKPAGSGTPAKSAALVAVAPGSPAAQASAVPKPPTDAIPPPDHDALYSTWTTYAAALRESRANGKAIMLDFNAEWCGPCQALKQEVFDHQAAGTTVKAAVIPVSIVDRMREDGKNPPEVEALQRQFKVESFPTLIIFSPVSGRATRKEVYAGMQETLRWITEGAGVVRP